jgi:hypothetical protein
MSTVPAAVFETSAVLAKLLVAVVEVVELVDELAVELVDVLAAGSLPPPPHAESASALALAASTAQLNRDLPMLKLSSSKGASRFPRHQCRARARAFKAPDDFRPT